MIQRFFLFNSIILLSSLPLAEAQVALSMSSGSAAAGSTVTLDLSLADSGSDSPAALQWTLNYSTTDFSSAAISAGPAATAAQKTLSCNPSSGSMICLLYGDNATAIANGVVATVELTLASSTTDPSSTLQLANGVASDPAGSAPSVADTGGTVTITSYGLDGFSCTSVSVTPPSTDSCTISMTSAAPSGGVTIVLSASPNDVSIPSSLTIAQGSSSGSFTLTPETVSSATSVTLTATYNSVSETYPITVNPAPVSAALSSVTLSSGTVTSGTSVTGTVSLTAAAPSSGAVVSLASSNTSAASVPASVTVPSGATSATFTITTGSVSSATSVTLTASYSSVSKTASLTIDPVTITVSSVSPNSGPLAGGTAVTITGTNFATGATVTFGGAAATNVVVANSTSITATTPAGSAGSVTVSVTASGNSGSLANGFTYTAPPSSSAPATIGYVQGAYAAPQTKETTVNVTFTAAQKAGDLNVLVVGWNDSTAKVTGIVDKSGNQYLLAVGPTVQSGVASQSIYYAKNIAAAGAGANTVTVTFSTAAAYPDIRILEYSGLDPNNPVDVTAASSGNSSTSSTGSVTTTSASDLIFGANLVQNLTTGAGKGFTRRLLTSPDGDIAEDRTVTTTGSYSATAPLNNRGQWIMQMVAFRAAAQ